MKRGTFGVGLALILVWVSCVSATSLVKAYGGEDYEYPWVAEVHYVPALEIFPDKDPQEFNNGIELDMDLQEGPGYAVRFGYGGSAPDPEMTQESTGSIGVFYLHTRHSSERDQTGADADLVLLDATLETMLVPWLSGHLGVGVGGMFLNYEAYDKHDSGAALMIRGGLGWRPHPQIGLQLGVGWFYWGYPTETIGSGLFGTVGTVFRF